MPDPSTILPILQFVSVDAIAVCENIDKAIRLRHEERHVPIGLYEDLCKEVDGLNTDTLDYKALLNSMENDTDLSGRSPYTRFIQRYVMRLQSSSYTHRANNLHYHRQDGRKQWKALKLRSRLPD